MPFKWSLDAWNGFLVILDSIDSYLNTCKTDMIIRNLGVLILFELLFCCTYSQSNFAPGYISLPHGDTTSGFIDYRNWERNPSIIRFKQALEGSVQQFSPLQISEFGVAGEIYVSAIVETENSPSETRLLSIGSKLEIQIDTVFLQTLFRGEKSLYYYKDSRDEENFYVQDSANYQLLTHKIYFPDETKRKIAQLESYKGQLGYYLRECPSLSSRILTTAYKKADLEKLFNAYYKCRGINSKIDFQKEIEKMGVEIYVLAGVTMSNLNFTEGPELFSYLTRTEYDPSFNPTLGIGIDFILPRNMRRWSFANDLMYTSYNVEGTFEVSSTPTSYNLRRTVFEFSYIKLMNLARYRFPISSGSVYVNAGISNGFAISSNNRVIEEFGGTNALIVNEREVFPNITQHEFGIVGGIGVRVNKFGAEARYERGDGMSTLQSFRSVAHRVYVLVSYQLN